MKHLQIFEYYVQNKELRDLSKEGRDIIFHAIKSKNAVKALENNSLGGYSFQRGFTMNALVFQSATLNPVRQNDGQIWVTASDLAKALGYKQVDAVSRIFDRNSDEFLCNMSQTVK